MDTRRDLLDKMLSNRTFISPDERKSVSRWSEQMSICVECGWETGPSIRKVAGSEATSSDLPDGLLAILDNSAVSIIPSKAQYGMFPLQVAEAMAEVLMRLPGHPMAFICCDESLLDGIGDGDLQAAEMPIADLSQIRILPNGMSAWSGDVPEGVAALLDANHELEERERRRSYVTKALTTFAANGMSGLPQTIDKLEDLASFYSYGNYKPATACSARQKPHVPAVNSSATWLAEHVRFRQWSPDTSEDFPMSEYRLLCGTAKIWGTVYPGTANSSSDDETRARIRSVADSCGIDTMVEALYAGVDVDDILA